MRPRGQVSQVLLHHASRITDSASCNCVIFSSLSHYFASASHSCLFLLFFRFLFLSSLSHTQQYSSPVQHSTQLSTVTVPTQQPPVLIHQLFKWKTIDPDICGRSPFIHRHRHTSQRVLVYHMTNKLTKTPHKTKQSSK